MDSIHIFFTVCTTAYHFPAAAGKNTSKKARPINASAPHTKRISILHSDMNHIEC
jgi:hypothetical protein